jgi:adenosylcobinamide-phosphate synthase
MQPLNLFLVYVLDLVLGDPEGFVHPVRGMGKLITFLERRLRGNAGKWAERIKGAILAVLVVVISAWFASLFISLFKRLNPVLGNLAWLYLGYSVLAVKDLRVKSKAVSKSLKKGSLNSARRHLAKIVSRDTQDLGRDKITAATIESIAENTSDGIVAPLFYLILGGPVLAIAYKAVNTLDSMLGYNNKRYLHFGWFSAKADDVVNFIPARISGLLISICARKKFRQSYQTMVRDGRKHISPNSGVPEAAMAGALGIRLGGASVYQGKRCLKPYIGRKRRGIRPSFIDEALRLSLFASLLMVCTGVILKWII